MGAITWDLITCWFGLPTSSSHALVGGMAGAAVAKSGVRTGQLASAAAFSLGHGANDAQKTMGIILALLIASGHAAPDAGTPLWVVLAAHAALALGTLTGGWRMVKTMGSKITRLQPVGGVAAESGAAITLFATSAAGIPVSTTHTITGAIVGVGAARRLSPCVGASPAGWCGPGC